MIHHIMVGNTDPNGRRSYPMSKLINHGPFRRSGVDEYVKRMSKPQTKAVYDSTVTNMLEKAGYLIPEDPASIYEPKQLWEQLDRYVEDDVFIEDEFIDSAIKRAFRAFGYREGMEKLSTLKTESEHYEAIKLEKHAGVYFSDKLAAWPRAWTRREDVLEKRKKPNPCLAGVRTQRGNKTRLVWMYPLEMTMLEAAFATPLISTYKNIRTPMPYSKRRFELGARLEYTLTERNKVALDFSKFDSSVSSSLIRASFRILATWFDFTKDEHLAWKNIVNYFINTPIVMIDGNLYTGKRKGVPSGSFFTQLIDSIANYIIITAAMSKFNYKPHEKKIHVLGDDSVFSTNMDVSLSDLKTYFLTKGFKLNVDKSEVKPSSDTIHFLGFDWKKGVAYRDVDKAILSMSQPEKWRSRAKTRMDERARSYRLIVEMSTLGANLYEVAKNVVDIKDDFMIHFKPEGKSTSSYQWFQQEYNPSKVDRNIATGLWI